MGENLDDILICLPESDYSYLISLADKVGAPKETGVAEQDVTQEEKKEDNNEIDNKPDRIALTRPEVSDEQRSLQVSPEHVDI